MSFLNATCPKCGSESAYHNGVCYECPDCDYEWDDSTTLDDDEDEDYEYDEDSNDY